MCTKRNRLADRTIKNDISSSWRRPIALQAEYIQPPIQIFTGDTIWQQAIDNRPGNVIIFATRQTGVSTEGLQHSMGLLNKNLGLAAAGKSKDLVALMQHLHISLRDSHGQIISAAEALPALADAFEKTKDPAMQALMATKLFGRAGLELLPLLDKGSAGLREFQEQFEKYGYTLSNVDVSNGHAFIETWGIMSTAIGGLTDDISAKLEPVLTPLIQNIADWTAKNRDWIASGLAKALQSVSDTLSKIDFKAVITDMDGFYTKTLHVVDALGGFKTVAIIAGGVMATSFLAPLLRATTAVGGLAIALGGPVVKGIYLFGASLVEALPLMTSFKDTMIAIGLAVEANPFGALALAVVAVGTAAYELYEHWNTVSKELSAVWNVIDKDFHKVFDPMLNILDSAESKADAIQNALGVGPGSGPGAGSQASLGGGRFAAERSAGRLDITHTHVFTGLPSGASVTTTSSIGNRSRTPNLGHSSMNGPR